MSPFHQLTREEIAAGAASAPAAPVSAPAAPAPAPAPAPKPAPKPAPAPAAAPAAGGTLVIACGTSVAAQMQRWCDELAPKGTTVEVHPIVNRFFGESVTVTGLITGGDLVEQLRDVSCDRILICRDMIRNEGDLFLDGMSVAEARGQLSAPLQIVKNTGEAFWRAISGLEE